MTDERSGLRGLLGFGGSHQAIAALADSGGSAFVSSGVRPFAIAALAEEGPGRPMLVVAGDDAAARALCDDLSEWLAPRRVLLYPTRGVAGGSHLSPPAHLVGLRLAALDALSGAARSEEQPVVVASAVALAERVPEADLRPHGSTLAVGDVVDLDELFSKLVECGYERVEQVAERAQFAVRGGIVDIFPATADHAVRIDMFDDEVESLRWFSTFTQRSLGEARTVEFAPAAELASEHRELAEMAALEDPDERPALEELLPLDRFRAPLELAGAVRVVVAAAEEIEGALTDWWLDVEAVLGEDEAALLHERPTDLIESLSGAAIASLSALDSGQDLALRGGDPAMAARTLKEAEPELERLVRDGYRVVVAFPREGDADRAAWNLVRIRAERLSGSSPSQPGVWFAAAALREGFVSPELELAVIPADRLVRRRQRKQSPRHGRAALQSFTDLRVGDTVVHEDHGIARFTGFDTKTVAGVTRDYLELEYAGGDRVFLPVDQLAKISRHVGVGGEAPTLSKLGGSAWERIKNTAKAAADRLAGELLTLYAERRRRTGYAFPPDGEGQIAFERAFPHRETADQLDAIEVVKDDMESARPMDRLICGDVGYGKTEVALRAAFKCADRRQAGADARADDDPRPAALRDLRRAPCATTPLTVDQARRFRPPAEQAAVVAAFNEGKVDILIGTHRLSRSRPAPKDLGL